MASRSSLELKVGIFAFIGLIFLTLAVFFITEINIFRPGYHIKMSFNFASGIAVGAPVRVAGVEAGEIEEIDLRYDNQGKTKIILSLWLNKDAKVPRDSQAHISVLGLIGDTYLEVIPGEDYAHLLVEGDMLVGSDPISTKNLMEVAYKVTANLDEVLGSVGEVLDEDTKADLKETIHNFREISENVKVISGRLERGEGKLGAWLKPRKSKKK